jgi:hypothetical protein
MKGTMMLMTTNIKKVYIAGPMSGHDDWNFPAFFEAERQLLGMGYEVINPAHNDGPTVELALKSAGSPSRPNHSWAYYMRRDLPHVLEVDAVCVLPGWQKSNGAMLEAQVARAIGVPLMVIKDGALVPRIEVIGLAGYARTGKDTAAAYFIENHGYKRMSFADPIREALKRLNPRVQVQGLGAISIDAILRLTEKTGKNGWEFLKEYSPDIRGLLQRLGTEVGREMFSPDFWVEQAINSAEDGSKIVFSDVRFPNEAEAIRSLGGKVIRINREGVGPVNDHPSETSMDGYPFDVVIENSGSIEDFHRLIGCVVSV